ncbi:MAG: dioxygenase [Fusobacteriaceae bacterium]|nr:dioxygenase [Fusobacteriaceae bacterium]MBN2839031.1 dioxygenase [Fusobacteriaceae bacterium]
MKMPILFIGHGSPMNAIENNEFTKNWDNILNNIPKPKGILAISAHWYTRHTRINVEEAPKTIYDMFGFPDELYQIKYERKTNNEFINEIKEIDSTIIGDNSWGYDHGIWSIFHRTNISKEIPVIEMSIDGYKTPKEHYELGKKLGKLREKGYLIVASGNIVHNLALVDFYKSDGFQWATKFDDEIKNAIIENDIEKLLDYKKIPNKDKAFKTDEHFLPLLYILGAKSDTDNGFIFNNSTILGALSMTSYMFKENS